MKDDDDLPDEKPSREEQLGADARRHAVEEGSEPLVGMLIAAASPRELSEEEHERILGRVLGELPAMQEEPAADAREREAAEALRRALEGAIAAREDHELAGLAEALRNAHGPRPITEIRNEALLRPALRSAGRSGSRTFFAAAAGVLALAASVTALWMSGPKDTAPGPAARIELAPGMVEARSTAPLFSVEDFPQGGGKTSERMDKISAARASDLRNNRYLAWGIE